MLFKWILPVIAVGVGAHHAPLFAQLHGHPTQASAPQTVDLAKIAKIISATPKQMEELAVMRKRFQTAKAGIDMHASKEVFASKMKALHEDVFTSLHQILEPNQIAILHKEGLLGAVLGERGHFSPMELLAKLNLTPTQTSRVEQIFARTHQALAEAKLAKLSPDEMKARLEAIHNATMQEVHAVLTPDQMKRLKEMMADIHGKPANKVIDP